MTSLWASGSRREPMWRLDTLRGGREPDGLVRPVGGLTDSAREDYTGSHRAGAISKLKPCSAELANASSDLPLRVPEDARWRHGF